MKKNKQKKIIIAKREEERRKDEKQRQSKKRDEKSKKSMKQKGTGKIWSQYNNSSKTNDRKEQLKYIFKEKGRWWKGTADDFSTFSLLNNKSSWHYLFKNELPDRMFLGPSGSKCLLFEAPWKSLTRKGFWKYIWRILRNTRMRIFLAPILNFVLFCC